MRIFGFGSPFRPSLVRLYKRHPRHESEEIFEWVLSMAEVRKLSLGCPTRENLQNWKNKPGAVGRHL
jgi:hypothetical protein